MLQTARSAERNATASGASTRTRTPQALGRLETPAYTASLLCSSSRSAFSIGAAGSPRRRTTTVP